MAAADKYSALLEVDIESDTSIDITALRADLDAVIDCYGKGRSRLVVMETPSHPPSNGPAVDDLGKSLESDPDERWRDLRSDDYFGEWDFHPDAVSHSSIEQGPPARTYKPLALVPPAPTPRDYGPSVLVQGESRYKQRMTIGDISEEGDAPAELRQPPAGLVAHVDVPYEKYPLAQKGGQYSLLFEHSGYDPSARTTKKGGKKVDPTTGLPHFESRDGKWRAEWEWPTKGEEGLALTLSVAAKHGWESIDTMASVADYSAGNEHLRSLSFDLFDALHSVPASDDNRIFSVFSKWASTQMFRDTLVSQR